MKARRIDLERYPIEGVTCPTCGSAQDDQPILYDMRRSLVTLLFQRELELNAADVLEQNDLGNKILQEKGDHVLLDASEYGKVTRAIDTARGFNQNDVELIRRVQQAPEVEMSEAPES